MSARLKIGYVPYDVIENAYTANFKRILSEFGEIGKPPSLKAMLFGGVARRFDLLILNWTDNGFVDSSTGAVSYFGVVREFVRLFLFKLVARKLIFVRHNIYPHSTAPRFQGVVEEIVNIYETFFDLCWVHSGHLANDKRLYIPHPLYNLDRLDEWGVDVLPSSYFVMFGRILPYKKIEKVIDAFPDGENLVIIGGAGDMPYLERLKKMAKKNILILSGYRSDEQAAFAVSRSKGLIVGHADRDMIVSGSILFALSLGVPVLSLSGPFIEWFVSAVCAEGIVSIRDYSDLPSGLESLSNCSMGVGGARAHFSDFEVQKSILQSLNRLELQRGVQ